VAGKPTMSSMLVAIWRARFPDAKPEWCGLLQPSAIQRSIMRPVLWEHHRVALDALPTASDAPAASAISGVPRYDAPIGAEVARDLKGRVDEQFWLIVERLGVLAAGLAAEFRADLVALPAVERPELTNKDVSAWACATVARPYYRAPALPSSGYLLEESTAYRRRVLAKAERTRGLPSEVEFADRYELTYDEMWAQEGVGAVKVLSPVDLGLGHLTRPPMRALANGWEVGTDRSVQHRYGLYLRTSWEKDPEATARTAGLDPGQHLSLRLPTTPPDAICRSVLERACQPIGLRFSGHHAFISSFVRGVLVADLQSAFDRRTARAGRELVGWAAGGADLPDQPDRALEGAVAAFADYWAARSSIAADLVASPLADWTSEVEHGAARRLWGRLYQREVVWEAPLVRSEAADLVKQVFQMHLRSLIPPPDGFPLPADPRLDRSNLLISSRGEPRELLKYLRAGGDGWVQWYQGILGPDADRCLPPDRYRDWALPQISDPDEMAEDR
jgi:hypothetical protein